MDDGKIEIVGFWSSTFVSLYTCKVETFKVFFLSLLQAYPHPKWEENGVQFSNMWQSQVEIEHYSVAYFDCITAYVIEPNFR